MPATERLTLDLPVETVRSLRARLAEGGFASEADVVAAAVAGWDDVADDNCGYTTDELRALIQQGLDSGEPIDAEIVFNEMRAEIERARSSQ